MPDKLSREELAAIRERDTRHIGCMFKHEHRFPECYDDVESYEAAADRRALLAHIDALTVERDGLADAINRLVPEERSGLRKDGWFYDGFSEGLEAAAALVRGRP